MTAPRRIRTGRTRIASLLLGLVFLARALLPDGFMPAFSGEGGSITVAMCAPAGPAKPIRLDMHLPAPEQADPVECPFAMPGAHAALLPEPVSLVEPATWPVAIASSFASSSPPLRTAHPPGAPPTGPPSHA